MYLHAPLESNIILTHNKSPMPPQSNIASLKINALEK